MLINPNSEHAFPRYTFNASSHTENSCPKPIFSSPPRHYCRTLLKILTQLFPSFIEYDRLPRRVFPVDHMFIEQVNRSKYSISLINYHDLGCSETTTINALSIYTFNLQGIALKRQVPCLSIVKLAQL